MRQYRPRMRADGLGDWTSTWNLVIFSILAGSLATFTLGYNYGLNNHVELLLPIMRMLDSSFCAGDFVVNAISGYEVRFYYSWICAMLARILSLPAALLVLTLAQNIGMALVTAFVARGLHGRNTLAPLVAVALVLSVESIQLGRAAFLRQPFGWPAVLSLSFAMGSLWQGIRLRPYIALALALPASLIHPLVGLETGGVGLAICGFSALFETSFSPARRCRTALHALIALGGLVLFAVLVWGPAQSRNGMDAQQFLDIYARFRVPHHVLPSMFLGRDYGFALSFLVASGLSWQWWRTTPGTDGRLNRGLLIGTGLILVLLLGGWLFVEVFPTRLWATLQTFRLVYVLKWFGLLLFAGTIGRAWASTDGGMRVSGWLLFLPVGLAQPHAALWAHGIEYARRGISRIAGRWAVWLLAIIGFGGLYGLVSLWPSRQTLPERFTLLGLLVVMVLFRINRGSWLRHGLSILWVGGVIGLLFFSRSHPVPVVGPWIRPSRPIVTLADASDPADRVALFCRERLPHGAVVLTPPNMGRFRLVAGRAIVVDFKCPTTQDASMIEWKRRIVDCYGPVDGAGFEAAKTMEQNYRHMTEERLVDVAGRYGATHAVLYPETATRFEVLYADRAFRLVRISVPAGFHLGIEF